MKVALAALRCPGTATVQFLFGNRAFRHKVSQGSPLTCCPTAQLMLQQMGPCRPTACQHCIAHAAAALTKTSPCLQEGCPCLACCAGSRLLCLPCTVMQGRQSRHEPLSWGDIVHFCNKSCNVDPAAAPACCGWTVMPGSIAASTAQHPAHHLQGEASCLHCQLAPICFTISAMTWALLADLMVQAFRCGGRLPACQAPASCSLPGRMARALLSRQCRTSSPALLRWLWRSPAWLSGWPPCGLLGWLWRQLVWRPPLWVMAVHAAGLGEPCACRCA